MELHEAKTLFHREVERLAPKYPFLREWRYGLIRRGAYRRLGLCSYGKKLITLNPEYIEKGRPEQVLDTILHELAHAIAGTVHGRPGQNHGFLWKAVCREIGAQPNRTKSNLGFEFEARKNAQWVLRNKRTGEICHRYTRRPPTKDWSNVYMKGRRSETLGMLELVPVGTPLAGAEKVAEAACSVERTTRTSPPRPEPTLAPADTRVPGEQLSLF